MSEHIFKFRSGAYTNSYAEAVGVLPGALDPRGLISPDTEERALHQRALMVLVHAQHSIVGEGGQVSLPSYPAKRVLPDTGTYGRVIGAQDALFQSVVQDRLSQGLPVATTRLLSVGYGPDGYDPKPGETLQDASDFVRPQIRAAARLGYRPVAEAATSLTRVRAALIAADDIGADIEVGLAFDRDGALAADGTTVERVFDLLDSNPDSIDVQAFIGANCGSLEGINIAAGKATAINRGFAFAYPNSIEAEHLRHVENIVYGTGGQHFSETVTVQDFASVARAHKFPVVSLCCGFGPECLCELKAGLTARSGD